MLKTLLVTFNPGDPLTRFHFSKVLKIYPFHQLKRNPNRPIFLVNGLRVATFRMEFIPVPKLDGQLSSCLIPEVHRLLESHPICSTPATRN